MSATAPAALRLYLIRHGETQWTASRRHTSHTDIALTANGESQARKLAPYLLNVGFSHVLTSPLQRARQTCSLAGQGAHAVIDPDLTEWDYGDYEGQRSVDILKQRKDWNLFRDGCPNGETTVQITERADRLITRLRTLEGHVALFSHGHFAAVLGMRWVGLPLIATQHFPLSTASLSILTYDSHHPDVAVIALWNALSGR
jgi:probable phosphoglycerate mutase